VTNGRILEGEFVIGVLLGGVDVKQFEKEICSGCRTLDVSIPWDLVIMECRWEMVA